MVVSPRRQRRGVQRRQQFKYMIARARYSPHGATVCVIIIYYAAYANAVAAA